MLAAAMRLLLKCLRLGRRRRFKLVRQAGQLWHYGRLCLRSLLYNSFTARTRLSISAPRAAALSSRCPWGR